MTPFYRSFSLYFLLERRREEVRVILEKDENIRIRIEMFSEWVALPCTIYHPANIDRLRNVLLSSITQVYREILF